MVLQRRPGDGDEHIDGDGHDAQLREGEGHIDAVFPALAHSDDAAGAHLHVDALSVFDGLDAVLEGMRCADAREEVPRRLDVVVVTRDACLFEADELVA